MMKCILLVSTINIAFLCQGGVFFWLCFRKSPYYLKDQKLVLFTNGICKKSSVELANVCYDPHNERYCPAIAQLLFWFFNVLLMYGKYIFYQGQFQDINLRCLFLDFVG